MPSNNGQLALRKRSRVVRQPDSFASDVIFRVAQAADSFPLWGQNWVRRDAALRAFLPTEPILQTAHYSTVARYAALGWQVTGPQRMASMARSLLLNAEFGKGWLPFVLKVGQDLYGTDNGGFFETPRDRETDPPLGLNHLDSGRCYRTGRDEDPVHYMDLQGQEHALKYFQVVDLTDFPSPIETAKGAQICAVSRTLRAAQVMRDIQTHKQQKISGRNPSAIYLLGGVSPNAVEKARVAHEASMDQLGNTVYATPTMIPGYSPEAPVSVAKIEFASLPDGWDEEVSMRMYLIIIANAYGIDYQDLAPLPGGNLGSGHQSQILDKKSKVKGPALFMQLMEHAMNFYGLLPNSVTFAYGEQDVAQDTEQAQLALLRAQERAARIASLEITPQIAAQRAFDAGDLSLEELTALGLSDLTGGVTLYSSKEGPFAGTKESNFWQKLWQEPAVWQPYHAIVTLRGN